MSKKRNVERRTAANYRRSETLSQSCRNCGNGNLTASSSAVYCKANKCMAAFCYVCDLFAQAKPKLAKPTPSQLLKQAKSTRNPIAFYLAQLNAGNYQT